MIFRTEVHIPKSTWTITHRDRLMLLGSCFADNIGEKFSVAGFDSTVNPFGTLYNPASIAVVLTRLLDEQAFTSDEMVSFGAEGWGSWLSHSLLSRPTQEEALRQHNRLFEDAATHLRQTSVLIITFGTAWVYRQDSQVVANCHHEPASRFVRERLTVDEIVGLWRPLLERLHVLNPDLRVLFTVSPIRHFRDGVHENQLSKSTLLLAIEALGESYFPSYELMLDELRDYRFYAEDMCHPSPVAVDYLWERFGDTYFDNSTRQLISRLEEITKALNHRPLHPDSHQHQHFLRQTEDKLQALLAEHPYLKMPALGHIKD